MTDTSERVCVGCGDAEESSLTRFDGCAICRRAVCSDCGERAFGRRFCSHECARAYAFTGDPDDDQNDY
jgi:hypothetical protein